jgi:hypothetical protein
VIVYLWDACGPVYRGHGVSDDPGRARGAADTFMRRRDAPSARVEAAHAVLSGPRR